MTSRVGFIGLGAMGEPMALNAAKAGLPLVVWNRTHAKTKPLAKLGATIAKSVGDLFESCRIVILMLADGPAIDQVLKRGTPTFAKYVNGHTIVHMGTTSPSYSAALEQDIIAAGGRYVEAPVSGSRKPAEEGKLVAMLAGESASVAEIEPILKPIATTSINCGAAPKAMLMKLAVNTYLIGMVTSLAEATNFARQGNVDMEQFQEILNAGSMASDIMRVKLPKLIERDFSAQAAIVNVLDNNRLVCQAAREIRASVPLIDVCEGLYADTEAMGHGKGDMAAVIEAIAACK